MPCFIHLVPSGVPLGPVLIGQRGLELGLQGRVVHLAVQSTQRNHTAAEIKARSRTDDENTRMYVSFVRTPRCTKITTPRHPPFRVE